MLRAFVSRSTKSLFAASCVLALPAMALPAGNVLVVDGAGSGSFTTIQAAVDAAIDGDVVVVQGGSYATFVITDKSLTVVADFNADVAIDGGITVRDLAATRTVVLANLLVEGLQSAPGTLSNGMTFTNNAGHLRVEGCTVVGAYGPSGRGVEISASADVVLVASEVHGGRYQSTSCDSSGVPALDARFGSGVTLYGSTLRGSSGSTGSCGCPGGNGGNAAEIQQSTFFASSSNLFGGDGGNCGFGSLFFAPYAGDGGIGVWAAQATVRLLETVTTGGAGGRALTAFGNCGDWGSDGADGLARFNFQSTYTDIPGDARKLSTPTIAHAGTTAFFTARGEPGDVVGVLFGTSALTATYKPAWRGMLLVPIRQAPVGTPLLLLGTVPPSGVINYPLAIPALAPGEPSRTTYVQAVFTDPMGVRTLSGARTLTIVP